MRTNAPIDSSGPAEYLRSSAHKVVQRNDTIAGHSVSRIGSFAEISSAGRDTTGAPRLVNPGDHYVALTALVDNFSQSVVLHACQLDADGDSLYDHWETEGVDVEQDGAVDLNLPAMGAQVETRICSSKSIADDDSPAVNPPPSARSSPSRCPRLPGRVFATAPSRPGSAPRESQSTSMRAGRAEHWAPSPFTAATASSRPARATISTSSTTAPKGRSAFPARSTRWAANRHAIR